MRDILNSYTSTELKKHISTYNKSLGAVKGYSKMKKAQLIDLMTKKENVDKFKSIKMKAKTETKKPEKKTTTTTKTATKTTTKTQPIKNPYKELDEYIKNEVPKFTDWGKLEDALKNKIETLFLNKNLPETIMPFRDRISKDTPKPTYFNQLKNRIRDNLNKKLREDRDESAEGVLKSIISRKFKLQGKAGRTFTFLKDYWKRLSPEVKKNTEEIIKMYNDKDLKTVSIKSNIKKMNGQYLPYKITNDTFYYSKETRAKASKADKLSDYIKENSKIKVLPFSQFEDSYYRNLEDIVKIAKLK